MNTVRNPFVDDDDPELNYDLASIEELSGSVYCEFVCESGLDPARPNSDSTYLFSFDEFSSIDFYVDEELMYPYEDGDEDASSVDKRDKAVDQSIIHECDKTTDVSREDDGGGMDKLSRLALKTPFLAKDTRIEESKNHES